MIPRNKFQKRPVIALHLYNSLFISLQPCQKLIVTPKNHVQVITSTLRVRTLPESSRKKAPKPIINTNLDFCWTDQPS